jgi:tol-pal system protein YbgF
MDARRGRTGLRALRAIACAAIAGVAATACAGGDAERARRDAELAALRTALEDVKSGRETEARERAKLAADIKAIDAQQAFLVAESKASREELGRLGQALDQQSTALGQLRAAVEEAERRIAALPPPAPPAAPPAAAAPAPSTGASEVSPDKLYATATASFRAEEHGQAVLEFTELVDRFPQHPLASNAQYWIGEAYYRQRDYRQALAEFQKVVDGYSQSAQAPEALVKIGLCHRALKDPARARESWEQVMKTYPGTSAAGQARSLLSHLGGQGRSDR